MDRVTVIFNSPQAHFSQLIAGLQILNKKGIIDLSYELDYYKYPSQLFEIDYNGSKVIFDMSDNSDVTWNIFKDCDYYVKRMLLGSDYQKHSKLIPFGLNYSVFVENKHLKYLFLQNRKLWKYSLKYHKSISKVFNINDSISTNHLKKMYSEPNLAKNIIFRSRLWNPANNDQLWKKEEREILNNERILLNRKLIEKYPDHFTGGISKDNYSIKQCPDLLLEDKEYKKKQYLKLLKKTGIGIVNQGLENSIGWKMAEYICHSMAVITNPIDQFKLLGEFSEGIHYLSYTSMDECMEKTDFLYNNDMFRNSMQRANKQYYLENIHPEIKLTKIFKSIDRT